MLLKRLIDSRENNELTIIRIADIFGISKSVLTSSKVTPDTSLEFLKVSPTSIKVLTPSIIIIY